MKNMMSMMIAAAVMVLSMSSAVASEGPDGAKLFQKKCKMCHKMERKSMGPSPKTMNSDAETLRSVIVNGKGNMPKFGQKFSEKEVDALVRYIQAQH